MNEESRQSMPSTSPPTPKGEAGVNKRNKLIWNIVFILIAALTVWAVVSQSKGFSGSGFLTYLKNANPFYLAVAIFCMLIFIGAEAAAILLLCKTFGRAGKWRHSISYAASDIYFSAITPSATGGQPACAFLMVKDGISVAVTTIALVVNLVMYTFAILALGIFTFVAHHDLYAWFNTPSKVLIIIGFVMQCCLAAFLLVLLLNGKLLYWICDGVMKLLTKIHLMRNPEAKREKLRVMVAEYQQSAQAMKGHMPAMLGVFLLNLLQRGAQITVTMFASLATGSTWSQAWDNWGLQSYTVIGSNTMPVPGAMGVSDYILLKGFAHSMSEQNAANLELLSRAISFYSCVVICGVVLIVRYFLNKRREKFELQ
jgi:uncharacterized protein (TIRG00374 family)